MKEEFGTVIGMPDSIFDLYWQLTKNYSCDDGTKILSIKITNLDGLDVTNDFALGERYAWVSIERFEH